MTTTGCQTLNTKQSATTSVSKSPSYISHYFGLNLQNKANFDSNLIDIEALSERIYQSYRKHGGFRLTQKDITVIFSGKRNTLIDRIRGKVDGSCTQIDAEYKYSAIHSEIECSMSSGFIIYELLISNGEKEHRLIDYKAVTNGYWMSDIFAAVLADHSGFGKIKESFNLIVSASHNQFNYKDYYSINGYIKNNLMLAIPFVNVTTDPKLRKEVSLALIKSCPNNPYCAVALVDYHFENERYDDAIDTLLIAHERFPRSIFINDTLAYLYHETGQFMKSAFYAQNLIWAAPSNKDGYFRLFKASVAGNDRSTAIYAAASMINGFQISRADLIKSISSDMIDNPEFWHEVEAIISNPA